MSNPSTHHAARTPTWNDVRRLADEIEVKMNLAGKEVRSRWQAFQPRLAKLEQKVSATGEHASKVVSKELADVGKALKKLIEDLDGE